MPSSNIPYFTVYLLFHTTGSFPLLWILATLFVISQLLSTFKGYLSLLNFYQFQISTQWFLDFKDFGDKTTRFINFLNSADLFLSLFTLQVLSAFWSLAHTFRILNMLTPLPQVFSLLFLKIGLRHLHPATFEVQKCFVLKCVDSHLFVKSNSLFWDSSFLWGFIVSLQIKSFYCCVTNAHQLKYSPLEVPMNFINFREQEVKKYWKLKSQLYCFC